MKRFILVFAVLAAFALSARAGTSAQLEQAVRDIQQGRDTPKQIKTLRVQDSGTVGGNLVIGGTITSGGSLSATGGLSGPVSATTLSASGATTLQSSVTVVGASVTSRWDNASGRIDAAAIEDGALPTAITVASANIVDGTVVPADVGEGVVVSPTGYAGTGVKIQLGSVTNGQVITFTDAFSATPAVSLGPEAATTNIWYVTGLTSAGFTAHTESGVAGGYIAAGLK